MIEKLMMVEIGSKKLPIRCDLQVLAAIQEEFGTLQEFEQKIIGLNPRRGEDGKYIYKESGELEYTVGEPNIKAIAFALPILVHEGIEQAIEQGESIPEIDWKQAIKDMDFDYIKIALAIYQEFERCFRRKKKTNMKGRSRSQKTE